MLKLVVQINIKTSMDPLFLLKLDEAEAYKKYYVGIFRYKVIPFDNY